MKQQPDYELTIKSATNGFVIVEKRMLTSDDPEGVWSYYYTVFEYDEDNEDDILKTFIELAHYLKDYFGVRGVVSITGKEE